MLDSNGYKSSITYLFTRLPGADLGLILGCCKILQKKLNIEMMLYAEKLQIQQEVKRYSFDYSRGADLKVTQLWKLM